MTTVDELRRTGHELAQAIAPTWESRRAEIEEVAGPVSAWMVRELAPRPGETVLELAAGVGDTEIAAARLVASDGRLICTDFSTAMLDAAQLQRGKHPGGRPGSASAPDREDPLRQLLAGIPVTERRLELAGVPTAELEGGGEPGIVLLHGPGESSVNWRWVLPQLVETHRVSPRTCRPTVRGLRSRPQRRAARCISGRPARRTRQRLAGA